MEEREILNQYYTKILQSVEFFAIEFCKSYLAVKVPKFHSELYDLLPKNNRLIVVAPRSFAKSTLCSVIYPLWAAVTKTRKDIVIISASESMAIEWLRKIKTELETNQKLIKYFPQARPSDKWSENHIILTNGASIRAKGAGGQIRGLRPDCIVLDDIETDETVASDELRVKLKDWLFGACVNTLLHTGQLILIGNFLHISCLLKELYENKNLEKAGWNKRFYQAYIDGDQKEGKELWKEHWPHKKLQIRKLEDGTWKFNTEFMNNPVSPEDAVFKPPFKYYEELPKNVSYFVTVDPAIGQSADADYSVILTCATDVRNNIYIVDYIRERLTGANLISAIFSVAVAYKPVSVGIETGAFQKFLYESCLQRSKECGIFPPFKELKPDTHTSKDYRIMALQPRFEQGTVYLKPCMEELENELLGFRPKIRSLKHDDIIDALSYQLQIIEVNWFNTIEEDSEKTEEKMNRGTTGYGD